LVIEKRVVKIQNESNVVLNIKINLLLNIDYFFTVFAFGIQTKTSFFGVLEASRFPIWPLFLREGPVATLRLQ
jgi:hypothetical protein